MKIVLTVRLEIDDDRGPDDRAVRAATATLARSDQSLADAVAAASSDLPPYPRKERPVMAKTHATPTGNPTIDALVTQVETDQTVIGSAVTLINGIAGMITAAVNAALAGGATAAQLAPLTDLTSSLAATDTTLAAAVAANTPAPPPAARP